MKFYRFSHAFMAMLRHRDPSITDADVLSAMEAPFLLLKQDDRYIAGTGLITPKWIHLYLQPRGLQLTAHALSRKDLGAFVQSHTPTILQLEDQQCLLLAACSDHRVCFIQPPSEKVSAQWLTLATLRKHLPETFTAYTLDACAPAPVDFLPLLQESWHTLADYKQEILPLFPRTFTRTEMAEMHTKYFRSLLVDFLPAAHCHDHETRDLLLHLNHEYRHLFLIGENTVCLRERLSKRRFVYFLAWLRENIIDRLYELGASDEMLEQFYADAEQPQ